jgi:hypothetical protein
MDLVREALPTGRIESIQHFLRHSFVSGYSLDYFSRLSRAAQFSQRAKYRVDPSRKLWKALRHCISHEATPME